MKTWIKYKIIFPAITMAIGFIGALVLIEVVLYLFPVCEPFIFEPLNADSPYMHYQPDREPIYSAGWNFRNATKKHVNNYGYANRLDYDPEARGPLLAVIGDSFVEAKMVADDEVLSARLAERVRDCGRVYSFSMGGLPLSGYLKLAELAHKEFHAGSMVFVIIANDFDPSLLKYNPGGPGYYYRKNQDGALELKRIDYRPSPLKSALRRSRLAMYLVANLMVLEKLEQRAASKGKQYVANVDASASETRVDESLAVMDAFFRDLPAYSGLPADRIMFVLDGPREAVYEPETAAAVKMSYAWIMLGHFKERAREKGYDVIDMFPVFEQNYKQHEKRFEHPEDNHWSAYGHEIVADRIAETTWFRNAFECAGGPHRPNSAAPIPDRSP